MRTKYLPRLKGLSGNIINNILRNYTTQMKWTNSWEGTITKFNSRKK